MRTVSAELQAFLDSHTVGVWAHLITITPRASVGSPVYWTDHSSALLYGGNTFLRGGEGTTVPTIELGRRVDVAGTEIGSLDVKLGCGADALFLGVRLPKAAADRMFDGAVVKVERVFGESSIDLSLGSMHVFEGLVAEARPTSTAVELDIESGLAALNIEIPRKTFKPGCHNVFGDAQCGIDLAGLTAGGVVAGSPTTTVFASSRSEPDEYFTLGVLSFMSNTTTTLLRGVQRAVRAYANASGTFTLDRPLPVAPAVGDTFSVYPGCPKTLDECQNKFGVDNRGHFRGFPFVPRDNTTPLFERSPAIVPNFNEDAAAAHPGDPSRTYGQPVPVGYGKFRIAGRFVYWGSRLESHVPVQVALCEGPIASVDRAFQENFSWDLAGGELPFVPTIALGTKPTQTPWTSLPAGKDLGYPGVAIVSYSAPITNGQVMNPEWEVSGFLAATGGTDDAQPADIIQDLLPDTFYGAAFPFPIITDTGLDGLAASSARRYTDQAQFWISFALTEKRQALDVLQAICDSINCEALWSSDSGSACLRIVPRADTAVGTFTPCTSVRYAFTERDFSPGSGDDPVKVRLDPETETFNVCPVDFLERSPQGASTDPTLGYQRATEEDPDPVDVALRDERPAYSVKALGVTRREHAVALSRILAQRQVRTRQEVEFPAQWRFCRLEPLDLVTVTDTLFPYTTQPFQIRQIEEDCASGTLTITGQEWTAGVNHATAHATQSSDGATTQWVPYDAASEAHEKAATTWTPRAIPASKIFTAVTWHAPVKRFVAVSLKNAFLGVTGGTVARCVHGGDWSANSSTLADDTYTGAASDGTTVVVVGTERAYHSADGDTWISGTVPNNTPDRLYAACITTAVGHFAAAGAAGAMYSTTSGATWTNATGWPSWTGTIVRMAMDTTSGRVVAIGGDTNGCWQASYSDDEGHSWSAPVNLPRQSSVGDTSGYECIAFGNGTFVVAGRGSRNATSIDGITWSESSSPPTGQWGLVAFTGRVFVAVDGYSGAGPTDCPIRTSRDGATWAIQGAVGWPNVFSGVAWGPEGGVLLGAAAASSAPVAFY